MASTDDEAWRAIVDNYGERARLDAEDERVDLDEHTAEHPGARPDEPEGPQADHHGAQPAGRDETDGRDPGERDWDDPFVDSDWSSDRFVPPPPPPVPETTTDRRVAWSAVIGSPAALLAFLVLGYRPPEWVSYLLVAGFVGGFLYLVVTMSREPRDPGDDGAVV